MFCTLIPWQYLSDSTDPMHRLRPHLMGMLTPPNSCQSILFRHQPTSLRSRTRESTAQEPASRADRVLAKKKEKQEQEVLHKVLYTSVDAIVKRKTREAPNYRSTISVLIDCIALLGTVNQELSLKRRDGLRSYSSQDLRQAYNRILEPGTFLFRND